MPNVRMPDGRVVAFPDDMPRSEIRKYVNENEKLVEQDKERNRLAEIERKRDEVGIAGAFGRGVTRGVRQTAGLLGDVLPAMVGQAFGADEYRDKQMKEYLDRMRKMEEEAPSLVPTYKDIDGIADFSKYTLETVGQFLPSIATSIGTGGIGGFIGQQVAKQGAKKLAVEAAKKYSQNAVRTGQISGAFAGSGVQTIPEAYATLEEETGDPKLGASVLVGSFNAALDSILPAAFLTRLGKEGREEVAKNLLAKTLQKLGTTTAKTRKGAIVKGALKSGVIEGLTEGTQEFNQLTASRILDENPEFWEGEDFTRILDATLRGSLGGKFFGGVGGAFSETETQKANRVKTEKDDALVSALNILNTAQGEQLLLGVDEEYTNAESELSRLRKQKNLPKEIKKILNMDLPAKQKLDKVIAIQKKLDEQVQPKTEVEKAGEKFLKDAGVADELIENAKIIQLGDETPPLLQIEFDPNATNTEKTLKEIRKVATRTLPLRHPIKKILDSKDIATPRKLDIFKKFQQKELARLDITTAFDKEVDQVNKALNIDVNKKEVRLPDARPTEYRIIDQKGKAQNVAPFANIDEATSWVQEQQNPENFKIQDQLGDSVYTGKKPIKTLPRSETIEEDQKIIAEQRKKVLLGQPLGKRKILSTKEAQKLLLTGQLKESDYYEASSRQTERFADEAKDGVEVAPLQPITKSSQEYKDAFDYVENKINDIASKGEQGKLISDGLRTLLNDKSLNLTLGEMVSAFQVSDVMSTILPESSGHALKFVNSLKNGKEQGSRDASANLIQLALKTVPIKDKDGKEQLIFSEEVMGETASHEAFHVMQDFFLQYDPTSKKILDSEFGSTEKNNQKIDYANSKTAKWLKRTNRPLHDQLLKQKDLTGRELQAYAFSAYDRARAEGNTPVMAGGLARYFNFVSRLLAKLGNYFQGMGFKDAQSVFEAVSTGTAAKSFSTKTLSEQTVSPNQEVDAEASSRQFGRGRYLEREGGLEYATPPNANRYVPINNGSPIITKVQLAKDQKKKNVGLTFGEKMFDNFEERMVGHGARMAADQENVNQIKLNTPHQELIPFIQEVVQNGKRSFQDGKIIYQHKPQDYKQRGVVVLEQDSQNPTFLKVMNAYARDESKLYQDREKKRLLEAERIERRQVQQAEKATVADIEEYRRTKGVESSAREIPVKAGTNVSTAFPTGNNKAFNPLTGFFGINSQAIRQSPQALAKTARQLAEYNILQAEETQNLTENEILDLYIQRGKENLLYIFDNVAESTRNRSRLWYVGANRIAQRFSEIPIRDYGKNKNLSIEQTSGILAALSPQKDWFQNASLAERVIDILTGKQNFQYTEEMRKTAKRIFGKKKYRPMLNEVQDKTLAELEFNIETKKPYHPQYRAMWLRIYDETYNDRGHRIVSPEGDFLGFARKAPTKKQQRLGQLGDKKGTGWGSLVEIAKAVRMYENDNLDIISEELGEGHKIRSFFNNINDPMDDKGSGTIDTHAVGALHFQPYSGKSIPVSHNFGVMATKGVEGAAKVGAFGSKGMYGINLEAYILAAQERNVLPREMQSITWEAVRGLFTPQFKTKENVAKITEIWDSYRAGEKTLDQTRQEVIDYANSKTETELFGRPDWERPSGRGNGIPQNSSYERQLPRDGISRRSARDDGRTGGTVTKGTTSQPRVDDEYEASSRSIAITDEQFRNAEFKKIIKGSFVKSGFKGKDRTGKDKLLLNRDLPDGTKVTLRPNLNGWLKDDGPPILTHSVHSQKGGKYGTVIGYDHIVSQRGEIEFNVNQKKRDGIAKGILDKDPMAGAVGGYAQLSQEEAQDIIQNADHVIKFNPKLYHLFVDGNGYAVKSYNGTGVHQNTNVFVKGEIEYWNQDDAPKQEGDAQSEVKYHDAPDYEASRRGFAQSFDEVITTQDDSIKNSFLTGLKKVYSMKDRFITEFVNSTEPIGELEEIASLKTKGVKQRLNVAEGAQRFMEMVMNTAGRVEMIMKYGAPQMDADGGVSIRKDTKGIFEIFKDFTIDEYRDFTEYALAKRAKALGEKEQFISPSLIQQGLSKETEKFADAFNDYQTYNRAMLDFMVDSGMLDTKQRNNLAKYDYIPFYRIIEEDTYKAGVLFKSAVEGPNITNVLNNPQKFIQEYKGGQKPIGDLLENIFRNTQAFVSTAMKNKAMQKAVKVMEMAEVGERVTNQEASIIKASQGGKVLSFRRNVKLKDGTVVNRQIHYDVSEDPHVYAALAAMTPRQTTGLFNVMERLGKIFREGITHAPPFMIANLIRGDMAGVVTVDAPLIPMVDTLGGLKNAFQETETIKEMKLIAGVGGYAMGDDYRDSARALKRQMRMRHQGYKVITNPKGVTDLIRGAWGQLTKVGEATELATREAIYRKLVDGGMSKADAAYEALNVINFNRRGASQTSVGLFVNSLLPLVPFLNARFQGLYRTFEPMVSGKQADRGKTIGKGLILMGANLALYSLMSQDDRWREEPMHRKLAYHIIYPNMLGLEDALGAEPILIPRAFEIGALFTSIPELFIDGIREEGGGYIADGMKHTFINTFSFNPIPQALIPAIEVTSNYDFFTGRELDTASQRRYLPSERVGPTTPEATRLLSKASQDTLSPNQISQLVNGYLGTLGGYALTAFDVAASEMGLIPNRPTGVFGETIPAKFAEALGFTRFRKTVPDPSNRFVGEFYELKKEVDTIYSTVNRLKKDGRLDQARDLFEKHRDKIRFRSVLNNINKQLQNVNAQIRRVRLDEKMSGNEKEERLKSLITRRNATARRVDDILKKIRES